MAAPLFCLLSEKSFLILFTSESFFCRFSFFLNLSIAIQNRLESKLTHRYCPHQLKYCVKHCICQTKWKGCTIKKKRISLIPEGTCKYYLTLLVTSGDSGRKKRGALPHCASMGQGINSTTAAPVVHYHQKLTWLG